MTQVAYVVFDITTGELRRFGHCQPGKASAQARANEIGLETDQVSLDGLKPVLCAKIDADAEAFCQNFVTPGETQMARYQRKEAQARAYLADNNASVPMLESEAASTGVSVATLAATVVAIASVWGAIMDAVEGARIGAKKSVVEAASVADAVVAAQVDWEALLP